MRAINPFIVSVLARGDHFADREGEVSRIEEAMRTPAAKLVVYGDRRLGKSSALDRAVEEVRRKRGRATVASFATASDATEGAQRILTAAQKEVGSSWREILEGIARALRAGLEVSPSVDPTGLPTVKFTFSLEPARAGTALLPDTLNALNEQLERRKILLGLGLDEFQRLHEWGGEDAEWAFRDAIQRHSAIAYVLAGSRRHLIEAMVGTKGRALWKLADVLHFRPLDPEVFAAWIVERAGAAGVDVPLEEARRIVRVAGPRTRDVVQLARGVWEVARDRRRAGMADVVGGLERVVDEQAELYRTIFLKLNARQQGVLRAFAADPEVQITSAAAIRAYRLGAKSSVQSTVEVLVEEEHLSRLEGGGYTFDDPFFRRWVQRYALPDIGVWDRGVYGLEG